VGGCLTANVFGLLEGNAGQGGGGEKKKCQAAARARSNAEQSGKEAGAHRLGRVLTGQGKQSNESDNLHWGLVLSLSQLLLGTKQPHN
jgi:hypothetical protein